MPNQSLYPDRFNTQYLAYLENQLDIENLKKGALTEEKTINGITYHRCISIDFCGIAASTLFNTDLTRDEITDHEARRRVRNAFRKLFDRKMLLNLNSGEEKFYLRVRFCFSYMYTDFSICMMKAEQNDVWNFLADKPIDDYYISKPVSGSQFKASKGRSAQEASLIAIVDILNANEDLIILGGKEKKVNTIQVRFCSIPSPMCTLIINNTAFCDPYLYAKLGPDKQLSLHYPVLILKKEDELTGKAFDSVRKHVNYLWRHDLTLFCGDVTNFRPGNNAGLVQLLAPESVIGPQGTNWAHKEKRIWEKKMEIDKTLKEKSPEQLQKIREWKANLNYKLGLCIKNIKDEHTHIENDAIHITVGMRRKFYYFKIDYKKGEVIFEYLQAKASTLYCAIAHYSYACLEGHTSIMHTCISAKNQPAFRNSLITQLNNYDLDQNNNALHFFDKLFTISPDFELKIPASQISFDYENRDKIGMARYGTHYEAEPDKSCLDFVPHRQQRKL